MLPAWFCQCTILLNQCNVSNVDGLLSQPSGPPMEEETLCTTIFSPSDVFVLTNLLITRRDHIEALPSVTHYTELPPTSVSPCCGLSTTAQLHMLMICVTTCARNRAVKQLCPET